MSARSTAITELLSRGPVPARTIAETLGIHQSGVSRALQPLERAGQVVRVQGRTRGARYGLAREVGDLGSTWPLYQINARGEALERGRVHALAPDQIAASAAPSRLDTLCQGLPYFLQDGRPGGFIGRALPAAFPELSLPPRVQDWSDDHVLTFLARRGSDLVGDLLIGTESLDRYLAGAGGPPRVMLDERSARYVALSDAAMRGAPPGSSAQGEHPKFAARLVQGDATVHVLVKFSPPRDSAAGLRWADLLLAECTASQVLLEHGISAARSQVFEFGDRMFLESERFDRVGAEGRRGVVSLFSVDVTRFGMLDRWVLSAQRLHAERLLSLQDLERVALLDAFGDLIANSDRHFGNLSLFDDYEGPFGVAPVYDMLPMLFAPLDGQIVERVFEPAGATAATLSAWPRARELAEIYWRRLAAEPRLSESFRLQCEACLQTVRRLRSRGTASLR